MEDAHPPALSKPSTDKPGQMGFVAAVAMAIVMGGAIAIWTATGSIRPPVVEMPDVDVWVGGDKTRQPMSSNPAAAPAVPAWSDTLEPPPEQPDEREQASVVSMNASVADVSQSDTTANLLLYFPFDRGMSNASSVDLPERVINGQIGLVAGVVGSAASFDGSGAALELPGVGGLTLNDELTLEFWVKPNIWKNPYKGSAHVESVISHSTIFTVSIGFDDFAVRAALQTDSPEGGVRLLGGKALPEQWHHVALVYRGSSGTVTLYLNGEDVDRAAATGAIKLNAELPLVIGTWYQRNQAFSGLLDEVRLWDRALPATLMRERAGAFGHL